MKTAMFGWLFGLGLLISHVGCCSVRFVGDGCGAGACGDVDCEGVASCGSLRARIADRIRSTNCGSGCGEIYWDEHINEPPVCDPCGCNGEFECGSCRSCPTALGRLRNLWGYRYMPSSCGECNSCGVTSMHGGASSCSTCASNTQSYDTSDAHVSSHSNTMNPQPTENSVITRTPTPAKPKSAPSAAPKPTPDSNATLFDNESTERLVIGSGAAKAKKSTIARPVSTSTKQSVQGKPRLVTNPR